MKKEYQRIKDLSRRIIGNEHFKKIVKIKDFGERTETLKYLVGSKFKLRLLELEHALEKVDKKEAWVLESKIKRLGSKIKVFESTFDKKDYLKIHEVLIDIEKELKLYIEEKR